MPKKDADGLTAKRRAYIKERAEGGKEPLAAYNAVYDDHGGTARARAVDAQRLETNPNIALMIAKHRAYAAQTAKEDYTLSIDGLLCEVAEILSDPEATRAEKLAAIDRAAKLQGLYESKDKAPINVNVSGGLTLEDKRAAALAWIRGEE